MTYVYNIIRFEREPVVKDHRVPRPAERPKTDPVPGDEPKSKAGGMEVGDMSTYLPTIFGENLMDMFDDFDRNFFRGFGNVDRNLYGKHAPNMMKTDVKETENGYEVDVELPGFKKDEIHLDLERGYLTISTEKSLEKKEENEKGKMLRQERYSGTMKRTFFVGEHVTEEDVKASYENGVLHLELPKEDAVKVPEKKQILIG